MPRRLPANVSYHAATDSYMGRKFVKSESFCMYAATARASTLMFFVCPVYRVAA